jgi:hypothetical protein
MRDWITASRETTGGTTMIPVDGDLETVLATVQQQADIPGSWWKRYPAEAECPVPRPDQAVVYTLMFGEASPRTGVTGHSVHWHRDSGD